MKMTAKGSPPATLEVLISSHQTHHAAASIHLHIFVGCLAITGASLSIYGTITPLRTLSAMLLFLGRGPCHVAQRSAPFCCTHGQVHGQEQQICICALPIRFLFMCAAPTLYAGYTAVDVLVGGTQGHVIAGASQFLGPRFMLKFVLESLSFCRFFGVVHVACISSRSSVSA